MSATTIFLLTLLAPAVTWLYTSARWRRRAADQAAAWQCLQADLLAEIDRLKDDVARTRTQAAQVTRATAGWSEGYKQGCSDMIKAIAALHQGIVVSEGAAEGTDGK